MTTSPPQRFLILSQVYVPDPAAVGQHLHEAAAALAARGHAVRVVCSSRGYDDPGRKFSTRETIDGVSVRRYGLPIFSKKIMPLRLFGSAWAMLSLLMLGLFGGRSDCVIFSTSPPMVGVLALLVARLKRARSVYWAMDLNPDQLAAMGKLKTSSPLYRVIEFFNRRILKRSTLTVTLDRFMAARLKNGGRSPREVLILPPWAPAPADRPVPHEANPFRREHDLDGRFVVMYSGNHTAANPIDTVLAAAVRLRDERRIRFAFVGGGGEKAKVRATVEQHKLSNVLDLPYQPREALPFSLGAADVHVVTMGEAMVGIVHPCKVYGAMAVGRPILYVGPRPSHVTDMLDEVDVGRGVLQGDVDACVDSIRELAALPTPLRDAMGDRGAALVGERFDHGALIKRFCDAAERA